MTPRTGNFFDAGDVYLVRVGEPLGAIYGYQVTGLWQKGDTGAACYMTNPADCTPKHSCGSHAKDHVHGPTCGHEAVPHGDHVDYLVGGHLHYPHGDHCDDHGPVQMA